MRPNLQGKHLVQTRLARQLTPRTPSGPSHPCTHAQARAALARNHTSLRLGELTIQAADLTVGVVELMLSSWMNRLEGFRRESKSQPWRIIV
jgi:hypothetical protein